VRGAGDVRASLERQPRDPFAVDPEHAVSALGLQWGDTYAIRYRGGTYEATRRHGPRYTLEAPTPDGLHQAMLDDSRSW
jgi:hypothetical protein